jgi:hypothetical protein
MDIKKTFEIWPIMPRVIYARRIIVWANNMCYKIVIFKTKWEHKRATCGRGYGEIFGKGKLIPREMAKGGKKRVKQKKTKLLEKIKSGNNKDETRPK